jgi:hypothetical protein
LHSLRRSLLFESCDDVLCVMTTFCAIARSFRLSEEKIRLRILPNWMFRKEGGACDEEKQQPVTGKELLLILKEIL